ncbi:hypothetical protein [Streptomyces hawaiiensis]
MGDVAAAARFLQRALDTWGDPPLADIPATQRPTWWASSRRSSPSWPR